MTEDVADSGICHGVPSCICDINWALSTPYVCWPYKNTSRSHSIIDYNLIGFICYLNMNKLSTSLIQHYSKKINYIIHFCKAMLSLSLKSVPYEKKVFFNGVVISEPNTSNVTGLQLTTTQQGKHSHTFAFMCTKIICHSATTKLTITILVKQWNVWSRLSVWPHQPQRALFWFHHFTFLYSAQSEQFKM